MADKRKVGGFYGTYREMGKEELKALKQELEREFEEVKAKGLKLDMSRGKPSQEQLDFSLGLMDVLNSKSDMRSSDGTDCRNYGDLAGISDARNSWRTCRKCRRGIS